MSVCNTCWTNGTRPNSTEDFNSWKLQQQTTINDIDKKYPVLTSDKLGLLNDAKRARVSTLRKEFEYCETYYAMDNMDIIELEVLELKINNYFNQPIVWIQTRFLSFYSSR